MGELKGTGAQPGARLVSYWAEHAQLPGRPVEIQSPHSPGSVTPWELTVLPGSGRSFLHPPCLSFCRAPLGGLFLADLDYFLTSSRARP